MDNKNIISAPTQVYLFAELWVLNEDGINNLRHLLKETNLQLVIVDTTTIELFYLALDIIKEDCFVKHLTINLPEKWEAYDFYNSPYQLYVRIADTIKHSFIQTFKFLADKDSNFDEFEMNDEEIISEATTTPIFKRQIPFDSLNKHRESYHLKSLKPLFL